MLMIQQFKLSMNKILSLCRPWPASLCFLLAALATAPAATRDTRTSHKTIDVVLREPLPPEELSLAEIKGEFVIQGATFTYRVSKKSGAINALQVGQDGQAVILPSGPADIVIDQYRLTSTFKSGQVSVITNGKDKIVIQAKGVLHSPGKTGPDVDYVMLHTFFNDGMVVSNVKLVPRADLLVRNAISYQLPAQGQFNNYIHKRRDEAGDGRHAWPVTGRWEGGSVRRADLLPQCV